MDRSGHLVDATVWQAAQLAGDQYRYPLCGVASWVLPPGVMLIGMNAVILAL